MFVKLCFVISFLLVFFSVQNYDFVDSKQFMVFRRLDPNLVHAQAIYGFKPSAAAPFA